MNNFDILFAKKLAGGGSPPPVLIEKNITANGTYTASGDNADGYSSVSVDVTNSYTAQDEGKVVSNGALVAQTAMSTEITSNDVYDTTLYNSVTVNVPQGGGGESVAKKDVNFYDYDGTVVASYTAAEFAELTTLPDNPTHEGLTAQGWNWTLSDAKTYVASYGKLNIGQMYITSDGKTRLYIELTEGRLQPWLKLYLNANSELDIDWGDGSTHSTFTNTDSSAAYKNEMHTYASAGSYVIAITVVSGGFSLKSSSTSISTLLTNNNISASSPDRGYLNSIKRVEIGSGITSIDTYVFFNCYSLSSITIPNSVTSIGTYAFQYCPSLTSITIPNSVTSIGTYAFQYCSSLISITIPSSVKSIGNSALYNCYSLASITIPVKSIGNSALYGCSSLSSITIPNSVTSIGSNAFSGCRSLATITINKAEGSISGSPWGASTSSPTSTQIVWTG